MAQKSEIKAALDSSEKDLWTMVEGVHTSRQSSFLNKSSFHYLLEQVAIKLFILILLTLVSMPLQVGCYRPQVKKSILLPRLVFSSKSWENFRIEPHHPI